LKIEDDAIAAVIILAQRLIFRKL